MVPTLILVLVVSGVSAFVGLALVNAGSTDARKNVAKIEKNTKESKLE